MSDQIKDKQGQPIEEGTHVYTKFRGGRHEGDVEAIATSKEEAEELGVKNPPKVVFHDQNNKRVSHNPGSLEVQEDANQDLQAQAMQRGENRPGR